MSPFAFGSGTQNGAINSRISGSWDDGTMYFGLVPLQVDLLLLKSGFHSISAAYVTRSVAAC